MKKAGVLSLILAAAVLTGCTPATPRTITVQGVGRIKFVPNQVEMNITIEFTRDRLADALAETKEVAKKIVLLCQQFGIAETDMKTSHVSSGKAYAYIRDKQTFIGYRSTQSTSILLRNIDDFERFSGDLLGLRIAGIDRLSFSHSDRARFESEADVKALEDAAAAADALCHRVNARKGRIIYINNTAENAYDFDLASRSRTLNKNLRDSGIVVSPGILEVSK